MTTLQAEERENLAAHLSGMPAIYHKNDKSPQDDTARYFAHSLVQKLRSGIKIDADEMSWLNLYNKNKGKSRNKEEIENYTEEHTKKDLQMIFMEKMESLHKNYEEKIVRLQTFYEEKLEKKDKRIDDLVAEANRLREKASEETLKILSSNYTDSVKTIEKAHDSSNRGLVTALEKTTSLNQTLTSGIEDRTKRTLEKEKQLIEELKKISQQEEGPGFWDMIFTEFLAPNKDKFGELLSRVSVPGLTAK